MIEDNVFTILQNDFLNIQIANGFENTIKYVYEGKRIPSQIPDYPAVCVEYDVDFLKEELLCENEEMRILPIILYIFYQANEETYITKRKSLLRDFDKVFYRSKSILSDYHFHLKNAGIRTEYKVKAVDPEFVEFTQTIGTIGIRIELEYYKNSDVVDSNSFSLTSIPTADSRFTLTSNFASATSNLQNQINNIAISGANVWGTITGDLSNQTDLYNELQSLSSSITGIDLNGYSLSSHNHNLNDLSEKSYNNLDDLPNLDAYALSSTTAGLTGATLITRNSASGFTYFVNQTDRVGIGYAPNAALQYNLDVIGKIRCTDNLYTNNGLFADVNISSPVFKPRYNTAFSFLNYYNVPLGTALSSGEWGIGTQTPNHKFSISGNLSITGNIYTNGLSGYSGTITAGTTFTVTNGIITSVL